jgi:hypothetical protein
VTPLIAEMAGIIPDQAETMTWFDISEAWSSTRDIYDSYRALEGLKNPLPFMRCAIVLVDDAGIKTLIMVANAVVPRSLRTDIPKTGLAVATIISRNGRVYEEFPFAPFFCDPLEDAVPNARTIYFNDKKHDNDPIAEQAAKAGLVAVSFWLERLNDSKTLGPVGRLSKGPGFEKRVRKGKKPLFEWTTVVLEPRYSSGESLGGTHATPRLHDVRGHWVVRNNKRFWRKPHKRGDASKGVIFKDYQIKGQEQRA